jgi:hypothetical protein
VTGLPLFFTRHSLNRMRWLKVARPAIEAIIRAPTSRMSDRETPRIRLFGSLPDGRRVRVVAVEEENRVVIVTIIIDEER